MYIVTFEEHYPGWNRWIESAKVLEELNEVTDFVEFLYGTIRENIRDIHVWKATEIAHNVRVEVVLAAEE